MNDRRHGIFKGDGLDATGSIPAAVGGGPGAQDSAFARAIAADMGVSKTDVGDAAARVGGGGESRVVRRRSDRAFQHEVGRAGDDRRHRVLEADRLHTAIAVAAGVSRAPGAQDHCFAGAVGAAKDIDKADVRHGAASFRRRRDSGDVGRR